MSLRPFGRALASAFGWIFAPRRARRRGILYLLDLAQARFDGIPPYLSDESIRKWAAIMGQEEERLRRGDSEVNPYGLSGPEELFAVAVEAFFQTPVALMRSHAELYEFLASYFRQDPAAWSARPGTIEQ